ncbi:uncharacterized protein YjbI with pentapeptide repeats [Sphingobium xenophagum]|uniref:Uncharacterized protein YjbI with pentapeptide repeats n=1 Tax=Sphingobium xenophagum TaxID=121428 RepID=A0ABU1X168_SPHXE|nr:pentapeptide repeat-containing protein [Sphingobium xenophagum]MDR7154921.1 uncharacterized protein YjbI with pentapeptide repeats [Sphingobium xenophagum]
MYNINFSGSQLQGCGFYGCEISECDFSDANLSDVSFVNSAISNATFDKADMSDLQLDINSIRKSKLHTFRGREDEIFLRPQADESELTYADRPQELDEFVQSLRKSNV